MKLNSYEEFLKYKLEYENKFEEEKRNLVNERIEIEGIKRNWNLDSDRLKNSEDQLDVYIYQIKKLEKENRNLNESNRIYENDLEQLRKELNILSDSQNRVINELSGKENELKITKKEFESFKILFNELKENMNRLKIENQIELEKYKKALNENVGKHYSSEYVMERKLYWDKLEKEESDLKKGIMDIIKPNSIYNTKTTFKKPKLENTKDPKLDDKKIVTVKTQFIKHDTSSSQSEELY